MDKIKGNQNSDGHWKITLPGGRQRIDLTSDQAEKHIGEYQEELEQAIDNAKFWRKKFTEAATDK